MKFEKYVHMDFKISGWGSNKIFNHMFAVNVYAHALMGFDGNYSLQSLISSHFPEYDTV